MAGGGDKMLGRWMARVAAGLMALIVAGPAWAGVMSKAEFRLELRDAIVKLAPKSKVELVDDDSLRVVGPGDKAVDGVTVYVGNAYERYQNSPDALETIIDQMARTAVSAGAPAVAKENLVVLIRPEEYVQPVIKGEKTKLIWRRFAGDFVEVVAIDNGETFQMAMVEDVEPLFGDEASVWAQARANSLAKMGKMNIEALEPGVWTITNESSLALDFVIQPDTWQALGVSITGDPVAVFLQRNLLLLTDGGDKDRLGRVAMFVDQLAGDPEIISTTLFTRHNGVWSVLERKP